MTGTSRSASAKGSVMAPKRSSAGSDGVRPPCWNQACPRMMVEPAAMKLMATPDTIWLPRWVIEAKPWTSASADRDEHGHDEADPGRAGRRRRPRQRRRRRRASCLPGRCRRRRRARSRGRRGRRGAAAPRRGWSSSRTLMRASMNSISGALAFRLADAGRARAESLRTWPGPAPGTCAPARRRRG